MPIKPKNISLIDQSDLVQEHINGFLSPTRDALKYAEKKLEAACKAAELIKKHSDIPDKVSKSLDPLKTDQDKDELSMLSAVTHQALRRVNPENRQTIHEYLSEQDRLRKKNQLVYGKSLNHSGCLGLGIIENPDKSAAPFYQRKLLSTHAYSVRGDPYSFRGAVEFGVTYDNRIFIVPMFMPGDSIENLYKMAQGTFLKAVGSIQVGNKQVEESLVGGDAYPKVLEGQVNYVSVYNAFFDAPKDNIAVSLFALQGLGIDLSDTQVVVPNDNAPLSSSDNSDCNIVIPGKVQKAADFLNENHYPKAKALAEKQLTFLDKIDELFCSVDDQVLLKRNKRFVEEIYGEKELLKSNLIKLFNCAEELVTETEVTGKNARVTISDRGFQSDIHQPSTSTQALNQAIQSEADTAEEPIGSFNDYWQAIKNHIQFFKEKNIDLSFLVAEIKIICAYILQNKLTPKEKTQLQNWSIPDTITPGRGLDRKNISSFIAFYENDPVQTCINLLRNYSKGQGLFGALRRLFSLAWNRHYVSSVNQFLRDYDREELPDNLTIFDIFNILRNFGAEVSLLDNKSTLLDRLLFCAKLNGEENYFASIIVDDESLDDVPNQPTLPSKSTELLINKPGYQETSKFFTDAAEQEGPSLVLLGEQGKEASTACPPSPRVSGL